MESTQSVDITGNSCCQTLPTQGPPHRTPGAVVTTVQEKQLAYLNSHLGLGVGGKHQQEAGGTRQLSPKLLSIVSPNYSCIFDPLRSQAKDIHFKAPQVTPYPRFIIPEKQNRARNSRKNK